MTKRSRGDSSDRGGSPGAGLSPTLVRVLLENHDRFLRFLRRRVQPRDAAEEILHDSVIRGITRGASLRDERVVLPWFYRLLRNAIIDHARSESAKQRGLSALESEMTSHAGAQSDRELIDTICNCVTALVAALRADYATALNRVDLGGEPIEAFARRSGITRGNASVRLFRARRALRAAIDRNCGACAEHGGYLCECRGTPHAVAPSRPERRLVALRRA
jgi:RNA polymerase sigma factor (sigma-70 family)